MAIKLEPPRKTEVTPPPPPPTPEEEMRAIREAEAARARAEADARDAALIAQAEQEAIELAAVREAARKAREEVEVEAEAVVVVPEVEEEPPEIIPTPPLITPESVATPDMRPDEILVAMSDAGADEATLIDYINKNPTAVSGAAAYRLAQELGVQIQEFAQLTGEARVTTARTLGILPEGFDELPQEMKDAYAQGDKDFGEAVAVYNAQIQAEYEASLAGLEATHIQVTAGEWYSKEDLAGLKETDPEQYQAILSGGGSAGVKVLMEQRTAEFETTLKTMPIGYQEAYAKGGVEGYNAYVEAQIAELEATHTKLPGLDAEGKEQWIDNEQLSNIKETDPDIYTILTTQGIEAANREVAERNEAVRKQQEASAQLDKGGYKMLLAPVGTGLPFEVLKEQYPTGHNIVAYLRDKPDQTDLLIAAGYDATEVMSINEATKATEKYWTPDNNLDVYAAYIAGVDPEHLETLTGSTKDEIKGLPPSLREFKQSYAVTYPIPDYPLPKKAWPSLQRMKAWIDRNRGITIWHKEAGVAYEGIYGKEALGNAMDIELATYAFAPARVLEPRVELKDIKPIEWIIGGAQIALYTAPFWIPKLAKVLKPLSKLERTARTAGNTRLQVNIAREEMLARAWNDPAYAKFASNLQHQIQASMKADRIFLDKLTALSKISPQQLTTIEKLSGIKGLAGSVKAVGAARTVVVNAWNVIDKSKYYTNPTTSAQIAANESYLAKLGVLQTAQNNLANALAKASGVLTPAYQLAPMAGWQNVIANTEREIAQLNTELAKAEVIINKGGLPSTIKEAREYWLGIRDRLASAKGRLNTYQTASVAGKTPPMVAGYRIVDKTPTQLKMDRYDATQSKLDDYYRSIGKPRPTPAGGVATIERTLTAVETPRGIVEVGFRPQFAKMVAPAVTSPVPAVIAPVVGVAALPSIGVLATLVAPQIQITTPTTTQTVSVNRILTMTPEQAARIYGDEILVDAVSPLLIPREAVDIKAAEWLTPAQAIEATQQIAIQSYVEQIAQSAIKQAELLKTQGATQAAIQSAVQAAIQAQIKTIVSPALKTQVVTALQAVTAIQPIVRTGFWTIITPITPIITPIIPPPLPSVEPARATEAIAEGSYAWLQGIYWKYIPPPYDQDKPITLPRGLAPKGARLGGRTPQETIQMIGRSRKGRKGVKPKDISIDLGIVDAFITAGGTRIAFTGKGELTDVGKRIPSPTQGMSVDGAYPGMPVYNEGVRRPVIKRKKPKRKVSRGEYDFSDILEVRGKI